MAAGAAREVPFEQAITSTGGKAVVLLTFPQPAEGLVVDCLSFRNNYTASLSLRCKRRRPPPDQSAEGADSDGGPEWEPLVAEHRLMPSPHCEDGGQGLVQLTAAQFAGGGHWDGLAQLELTLRQPSMRWVSFGITDLKCYTAVQAPLAESALPSERARGPEAQVRAMLALSNSMAVTAAQQRHAFARFDAAGGYDIDTLSP